MLYCFGVVAMAQQCCVCVLETLGWHDLFLLNDRNLHPLHTTLLHFSRFAFKCCQWAWEPN